jgi:KUP system potassium uptake protein
MDDGGIQEEPPSSAASSAAAARLLRPTRSGGGGARWVDGSEVDSSESTHWSLDDESSLQGLSAADKAEYGGGAALSRRTSSGGFRRRLGKRPKRVDSLDVEAMTVRGAHGHGNTVRFSLIPTSWQ